MPSSIIEALPEINTGLISLFGALYAGYGIYIYQKINDAKYEKVAIRENLTSLGTKICDFDASEDSRANFSNPSYWRSFVVQKHLDRGKMFVNYWRQRKQIYGFTYAPGLTSKEENDAAIVQIFDDAAYSLKFALDQIVFKPITKSSYNDFKDKILELQNFANVSPNMMIDLGSIADETINNKKYNKESDYRSEKYVKKAQVFLDVLNRCHFEILPRLEKSIFDIEKLPISHNFKNISVLAIATVLWIMLFGIFLPPLLSTLQTDFISSFPEWLQAKIPHIYFWGKYALFMTSILPYMVILFLLWQKVIDAQKE